MTDVIDSEGRRFAAVAALLGALLMLATIALSFVLSAACPDLIMNPAHTLTMSSAQVDVFRSAMLTDSFGYYLAPLIVGGYYWSCWRDNAKASTGIAILALVVYAVLGLAGTSMQFAAIDPLIASHSTSDAAGRAASEQSWLIVVSATQKGLWWMEGPTLALWAIPTARAMRQLKMPNQWLLATIGIGYIAAFGMAAMRLDDLKAILELPLLLAFAAWMTLTGFALLKARGNEDRYRAV